MTTAEIITGVGALLSGGVIGAVLSFKLGTRKQDTSEFSVLIGEYKKLYDKQEARLNALEIEVADLKDKESKYKDEVSKLRTQLMIFEGSHLDLPLPMWMKDTDGEMIFLNSYYEDEFLSPRGFCMKDYLGKNDYSVWTPEVAKSFIAHDKEIVKRKQSRRFIEKLERADGEKYYAEVLKYPRMLDNRIIGISGIILKTAETKEELK